MADQLEPIHQAAYYGDLASINQLLQEDAGLLEAQVQGEIWVDDSPVRGCTPLMLAALRGHDALVARLLALGAEMTSTATGNREIHTAHWASKHNRASTLALLLDAEAPINARDDNDLTPLLVAASWGAVDCVPLLIAPGGDALELHLRDCYGMTALHWAAWEGHAEIVRLLLLAGADPNRTDYRGRTALDLARQLNKQPCVALLEAAVAAPEYPRLLIKARALLDARVAILKAHGDARRKNLSVYGHIRAVLAASPPCLKPLIEKGRDVPELLGVSGDDEELVACVKYVLGLEGEGGVVMEGQEPRVGMLPEVFVELCEFMVPVWARKRM